MKGVRSLDLGPVPDFPKGCPEPAEELYPVGALVWIKHYMLPRGKIRGVVLGHRTEHHTTQAIPGHPRHRTMRIDMVRVRRDPFLIPRGSFRWGSTKDLCDVLQWQREEEIEVWAVHISPRKR